jgi:hypothetical protein
LARTCNKRYRRKWQSIEGWATFGTLLQGGRWVGREMKMRLRFDNFARRLDVLLGGSPSYMTRRVKSHRISFVAFDSGFRGGGGTSQGRNRGRRGRLTCTVYRCCTLATVSATRVLMICSRVHPKVKTTLAEYREAGPVVNAAVGGTEGSDKCDCASTVLTDFSTC